MLTQDKLKSLFTYNHLTGIFVRKSTGVPTGTVQKGYRKIKIEGKMYYASRLAWLYMTGSFPENQIDHINRHSLDDSFSNLREATSSQNKHNSFLSAQNTSGVKGVSWDTRKQAWRATFRLNQKHIFIGNFKRKLDAIIAYNYNVAYSIGEFALLNPVSIMEYAHD